ncbi:hypothetical protein Hanom_Chr02g00154511 [Helianthus anomalus]
MFMPAPKPGEGSSSGPSDADVVRATELLQAATREVEAETKSSQEGTHEAADSSDNDDLFEENETTILKRKITILEEDKIFTDAQSQFNGRACAIVMDMKQKLEGKVLKEFVDPPKETTAEERAKEQKEHDKVMDCYIANPPRTANQKPKKKMVVIRNLGAERDLQFGDKPDRSERVKQCTLHNQTKNPNCKIGWNFFNKLQQHARVNFKDMKLAQSIVQEDEEVMDPAAGKPYKTVK